MTKLVEAYFRLDIHLDEWDKQEFQSYLESRARSYAAELFGQQLEYAAYVEEGSLRGWLIGSGRLMLAGALLYGSLREALDYAIQDARLFSERVHEDINRSGISDDEIQRFERRLGVPGQLNRIFERLDNLERHGRDISKDDFDKEVRSIRNRLANTLRQVDNEPDRELILKEVPNKIQSMLPKQRPVPDHSWREPIALRPEEWERLRYSPKALLANQNYVLAPQPIPAPEDKEYQFIRTTEGFRLTPKQRKF
jgi:hypothetical protein